MEDNAVHTKEFYTLQAQVHEHEKQFDKQLFALKELIETKFEAIKEATDKALASNDKRLEGMNEFRQTIKDQNTEFVRKGDFLPQIERIREEIKILQISRAEIAAKADEKVVNDKFVAAQKSTNRLLVYTIVSIVIALIALAINYFK